MSDCFPWYQAIFKQLSKLKYQKLQNLQSETESVTTYWKDAVEVNLKYALLF